MSVDALLDLMRRSDVRSVSATPSFWRRLITLGSPAALGALRLEQITLGGEIADQHLLDALRRLYPEARLVHLYGSSEVGRCFTVTDGRAGFPARFLDVPSEDGIALKIEDGELLVQSANAMIGSPGTAATEKGGTDWVATGDLVERVGDRCYFVGRRDDLINVGGNKVRPLRVEQVIQSVPGVRDVRVFARRSSLVGQMVACEYVTEPGFDAKEVEGRSSKRVANNWMPTSDLGSFRLSRRSSSRMPTRKSVRSSERAFVHTFSTRPPRTNPTRRRGEVLGSRLSLESPPSPPRRVGVGTAQSRRSSLERWSLIEPVKRSRVSGIQVLAAEFACYNGSFWGEPSMPEFAYQDPFPLGPDSTRYRLLTSEYVTVVRSKARRSSRSPPRR